MNNPTLEFFSFSLLYKLRTNAIDRHYISKHAYFNEQYKPPLNTSTAGDTSTYVINVRYFKNNRYP